MTNFERMVTAVAPEALYAEEVELLQVNLGSRCNMSCEHCHHESGPSRTESMGRTVFEALLRLVRRARPAIVDVTGGAPELHPHIREWVEALRMEGLSVQIRTNLSVLLEPECRDLPQRWAELGVRLLASLPSYDREVTDEQRGPGAFERSIEAMHRLVGQGYGAETPLRLDIASNHPMGEPADRKELEEHFRRSLKERHGMTFGELVLITNVPLGRHGRTPESEKYIQSLEAAFNPATVSRLACRSSLAVVWDGTIYDCDFNLAAGIPIRDRTRIQDIDELPGQRLVTFDRHCFACTAREGSS